MKRSDALSAQLGLTLRETDFPALGEKYRGKVRDTYRKGDRLTLITTDRLSAFDCVLTTIPFKGEILNRMACFWFERTKNVVANHLLDMPHPNVMVAKHCEGFAVEFVVRGYLTGSLWRDYQAGKQQAYGLPIPLGMKMNQKFEAPILTPSTKAPQGEHDLPISAQEIVARGLMTQKTFEQTKEAALALFAEGQRWADQRGLILVDTKYEFGESKGTLLVMDEMHTPDSSRYWLKAGYAERFARGEAQQMLDKENIRQWLIEKGFSGHGEPPAIPDSVRIELAEKYATAYEQITGEKLTLTPSDVSQGLAARFTRPAE